MGSKVRRGLTLGQMMRIVVLWSGACAATTPFAVLWRAGMMSTAGLILAAAFVMPLALAGLALVLVRPGLSRDRLILVALLASVSTGLGIASFLGYLMAGHVYRARAIVGGGGPGLLEILAIAGAIALLAAAFAFLATRLYRSLRAAPADEGLLPVGYDVHAERSD